VNSNAANEQYVTVGNAATATGISERTLRYWIKAGKLPATGGKRGRLVRLADVLMRELLAFRVKINLQTEHDSYEAWREKDHDDLVLAVALAVWRDDRHGRPRKLDAEGRTVGRIGSR
jgi:excisionase family DNA binding protein